MSTSKNPLIVGGAIAFLILAGLAWNYTEAIKAKNKIEMEKITSAERMKEEELRQEQARVDAERTVENERQSNLDTCLASAYDVYSANWDTSCARQADEQETSYNNCVSLRTTYGEDKAVSTKYCRQINPVKERKGCTLPSTTSARWDEEKRNDEQACYQRYGFKN